MGGIQSCTLCFSSTETSVNQPGNFKRVIPEDSVTFQQAEGPRLRPGKKEKKKKQAERKEAGKTDTREEMGRFLKLSFSKEETKRNKATVQLGKLGNKEKKMKRSWDWESLWEYSTQWKSLSSYRVPIKVHWPGRPVTNYPSGSTYDSISMVDSFLMSNRSPRISAKSPPDDCINMQPTLL